MTWLYYLLEANLYLLVFYAFYRLFLHRETFYNSNRYFLLSSSLIAFMLPVLQLGLLRPTPILNTKDRIQTTIIQVQKSIHFTDYFYPIYLFIAFCLALKLSLNLYKIVCLWLKAKKTKSGKVTLVELKDETSAFSFFNLLFIHPHLAKKQTVLKHEMIHIKQGHSFDILFFELLQIVCWFNPITYFVKNDIKLLHEYIADELTTNNDIQKHEYALFLIQNSFGINRQSIANQFFNQSILKRRINMLNKKRTAARARLRLLLIVPLVAAMLCTSTLAFTKDYGYVDLLPEKSKFTPNQTKPKVKDIKRSETPKVQDIKRQAKDQVKPAPPVVKQKPKNAPAIEPPPPKVRKDQVKFPPPIVKPASKKLKNAAALKTPPPPVEKKGNISATPLKKVTIYADPIPSKKTDTIKVILGDPIKTPELELNPVKQ